MFKTSICAAVLLTACGSGDVPKTSLCSAALLTACGDVPGQHLEGPVLNLTPPDSDSDQAPICDTENLHGKYTMTVSFFRDCGIVTQQIVFCAGGIETCKAPDTKASTSAVSICKDTKSIDFDVVSCHEQTSTTCWSEREGEYLTTISVTHTDTGAEGNIDVVYFGLDLTCTGEIELVKS